MVPAMPLVPTQLRFCDLKARGIVRNWVTLRHWVNKRGFPPGRRVGNTRLWDEPAVAAWLDALPTETKPWPAHVIDAPPVAA
jgi:hypothetical protein